MLNHRSTYGSMYFACDLRTESFSGISFPSALTNLSSQLTNGPATNAERYVGSFLVHANFRLTRPLPRSFSFTSGVLVCTSQSCAPSIVQRYQPLMSGWSNDGYTWCA